MEPFVDVVVEGHRFGSSELPMADRPVKTQDFSRSLASSPQLLLGAPGPPGCVDRPYTANRRDDDRKARTTE
jgi:hypothetical protein